VALSSGLTTSSAFGRPTIRNPSGCVDVAPPYYIEPLRRDTSRARKKYSWVTWKLQVGRDEVRSVSNSDEERSRGAARGGFMRAGWLRWRGGRYQTDHPDEVVGSCDQVAGQLGLFQAAVARPSEPTHRLHPAEDLLDPFADTLTDGISSLTRRSAVDRTAPATGVLRHMWRHVPLAELSDTGIGVRGPTFFEGKPPLRARGSTSQA